MIKFLLFAIALLFIQSTGAFGQMMPVPSTIRTPYGNAKTTTWVRMPYYNNGGTGPANYKHNYVIVLLNNDTIYLKAKIDISDSVHSLKNQPNNFQKTIYTPKETREIYLDNKDGQRITGIPSDTCWLFKTATGKINFYSFLPYETGIITAIQQGTDGAIKNFTKENVLAMVSGNEKATALAEKGKLLRALRKFNEE